MILYSYNSKKRLVLCDDCPVLTFEIWQDGKWTPAVEWTVEQIQDLMEIEYNNKPQESEVKK